MSETTLREVRVSPAIRAEFPGLRLFECSLRFAPGPSAPGVVEQLRHLSSRFTGARAVALRTDPVPQAYRLFLRLLGVDPDTQRSPAEQAALGRLMDGAYTPRDRLSDALLLAIIETGVPVWALDETAIDGPLEVREARAGETLGRGPYANGLPAGRLVVADSERPVAVLMDAPVADAAAGAATPAVRLYTVQVEGVPSIHVDEALDLCVEALGS